MTMGLWWMKLTILENKKNDIGKKFADTFFLGEISDTFTSEKLPILTFFF